MACSVPIGLDAIHANGMPFECLTKDRQKARTVWVFLDSTIDIFVSAEPTKEKAKHGECA
jgi:hypothetical protein